MITISEKKHKAKRTKAAQFLHQEIKEMKSLLKRTTKMRQEEKFRAINTAQTVNTAIGVSTARTQVNTANIDNLSDAVICAFLASQPSSPQLGVQHSKKSRYQAQESIRRIVPVETPASTALVSCDGVGGYDWSDQVDEGLNYALMAYTSTSLDSKVSDDEEENVTQPKIVRKIVKPSIPKIEFVTPRQQEKKAWKTVKQTSTYYQFTCTYFSTTTSLPSLKPCYSLHSQFLSKSQQATTRNRGKAIVNSQPPTYDQEPEMVAEDDALSKEKEIDKLMALISLSFKKSINLPTTTLELHQTQGYGECRIDNGTKFVNKTLTDLFESVGITHQISVPWSPQQNDVVERRNQTLMEAARTMLIFAKAPLFLWDEAVATAYPKSFQDDGFQPSSDSGKNVDEDPSKGSECKDQEQDDNVNSTNNVNAASTNKVNAVSENISNELLFDPDLPALEDVSTFNLSSDHKDDDEEANINNMDTTIQFSHMDVKSVFLYVMIKKEVYVCQPPGFKDPDFLDKVYKVEKALYGLHQAPRAWFTEVKNAIETQKPLLKDEYDEEVDVYMYRIFRYLKGHPKLGLWYLKDSPFLVAYTDSDYAGASLDRKSTTGGKAKKNVRLMMDKLFEMELELILMLKVNAARHKLLLLGSMLMLLRFWTTTKARTINKERKIHVKVDGKKVIISEASIRRDLMFGDEEGVDCLPTATIFKQLALMGSNNQEDAEMLFDVIDDLRGEEVFVAKQDENVVEKEVDAT
nr:integrase, catalytic region, zinc finger, CCHC-type, peptidase aspartic, catalytic [Tanacetum cinerariifolium]